MSRNPFSLLAMLLVVGALATGARRAMEGGVAGQTPDERTCVEADCVSTPVVDAMLGSPVVTMDEREACRDAAYLCRGLEWKDGMARALRWDKENTRLIRVRVPLPAGDRDRGRAVKAAAEKGILAWYGNPFPIQIENRDGFPTDFTVQWVVTPPRNQLGQAGTRWIQQHGHASLQVTSFRLSLVSPGTGQALPRRQIELTAAHEMGHALGLPHSDESGDVMYPTNTANTLSARDYRAMQALYRLPNGVGIWSSATRESSPTGR